MQERSPEVQIKILRTSLEISHAGSPATSRTAASRTRVIDPVVDLAFVEPSISGAVCSLLVMLPLSFGGKATTHFPTTYRALFAGYGFHSRRRDRRQRGIYFQKK